MDKELRLGILKNAIRQSAWKKSLRRHYRFQYDNNPKH